MSKYALAQAIRLDGAIESHHRGYVGIPRAAATTCGRCRGCVMESQACGRSDNDSKGGRMQKLARGEVNKGPR